ncbi:hypothetical protein HanRHA438_Chr08g0334161 [Helianthus annuus]|nr:hypothetical protein HanIR_Chr08g0348751 [Helianthus annuus]KAJ0552294.1 hypothetical protein HanHA89_Chr08g0283681 [Helianthus annuus]KAJ0896389.1 hypothetical protein HanRHA438_Chr08g0334161 [Helianthus annuus]
MSTILTGLLKEGFDILRSYTGILRNIQSINFISHQDTFCQRDLMWMLFKNVANFLIYI